MNFVEFYFKVNISFFKKAWPGYRIGLMGLALIIVGSILAKVSTLLWLSIVGSILGFAGSIIVLWANIIIIRRWFNLSKQEPVVDKGITDKQQIFIEKKVVGEQAKLFKLNLIRGLIAAAFLVSGILMYERNFTQFNIGWFFLSIVLTLAGTGFLIWITIIVLRFHWDKYKQMKKEK
jgi:protein-S-isoprenylcysteine O-methyltransferase Ste14